MKPRLPRKYKKQIKKLVSITNATKYLRCAIVSMQSSAQLAMISARPIPSFLNGGFISPAPEIANKALCVVELVSNTAHSISNIMNEHPKSWRDFIR